MTDRLCPFSAPLIKQDFGCQHAKEIVPRGGAEIACEQADAHLQCSSLHDAIKQSALVAMGHEDDLLTVPHNVLIKIQYGGLLGLQASLDDSEKSNTRIEDITTLVVTAMDTYPDLKNLPFEQVSHSIKTYKTQRRGKK